MKKVLFTFAAVALLITNEQRQCTYMNPAAEALTGYTVSELQGRPIHVGAVGCNLMGVRACDKTALRPLMPRAGGDVV